MNPLTEDYMTKAVTELGSDPVLLEEGTRP